MAAPFAWGEVSITEGTGKGKWEVVKTPCLSLNNMEECWAWEDTAEGGVPEGDSLSLIPQQQRAAKEAALGRPKGCRGQRDYLSQADFASTIFHSPFRDGTQLLPNWLHEARQ